MSKPFNPQDKYFKRAKEQGYRARSVFKLEEIQRKFKILKPGRDVLDLGAAPGSWLQYANKIVGPKSTLVGLDLTPIKKIKPNVILGQVDIFSLQAIEFIQYKHPQKFPIILSDLAPKTSGIKESDHYRSIELSQRVVELAEKFLTPHGVIVIKVFQGADFGLFIIKLKRKFKQVNVFKPRASRDRSYEVYVIIKV